MVVAAGIGIGGLFATPEQSMQTVEVSRATFQDTVDGKGTLEPARSTIASAEVEGIVDTVNVSEGSVVAEGDVLYTIRNADLDAAVAQTAASLQSARDTLAQANNKLKLARTAPSAGSAESMVASSPESQALSIADAKSQVSSAQAALDSAQSTYDAAVAKADKRTVRATMAGTVLSSNITAGTALASLTAGGKPALQISDMSKLLVKIPVSEVDIAKVKEGQKAQITFDAIPNLVAHGTVARIAQTSTASASTGSASAAANGSAAVRYEVTLQIDEPDARLKSGMTAHAKITATTIENALIVPRIALVKTAENTTVVKLGEKDSIDTVEVKVEASNASQAVVSVVSGTLEPGDQLMVTPETDASASEADAPSML